MVAITEKREPYKFASKTHTHLPFQEPVSSSPKLMRLMASTLVLLLPLMTSCSGELSASDHIDAGYSSQGAGAHSAAVEHFDAALAGMDSSSDQFVSAKMGWIQSQCHLDTQLAKEELLALPGDLGVAATDYSLIIGEIVATANAQAATDLDRALATITHAVDIVEAGTHAFPEYGKWAGLLATVGDRTLALGASPAVQDQLANLGYLGED